MAPYIITDREMRIEMRTYSIRCSWCKKHKPVYEHPEDKKTYCKNCIFKVEPWIKSEKKEEEG